MWMRLCVVCLATAMLLSAQNPQMPQATTPPPPPGDNSLKAREQAPPPADTYRVEAGTHILMTMVNAVSSKNAHPGDRLYLKTAFPVMANGRIVIPAGSYVTGTITEVKRAGRVKGRSNMELHFDSVTLPNGASRSFKSDLAGVDGLSDSKVDNESSKVSANSSKGHDAATIAKTTAAGAGLGTVVGAGTGRWGQGLGIGSAAGLATGIATVLLTRGPDVSMAAGSTVELVTDRAIEFDGSELVGEDTPARRSGSNFVNSRSSADEMPSGESHGGFKPVQQ